MSEFVTINLDECDICHHDNGEALISYIMNDRILKQQETWNTASNNNIVRKAHALCLDRWDHIMKRSFDRFCPLRRSWSSGNNNKFTNSSLTKTDSNSHENLIISCTWKAVENNTTENKHITNNISSSSQNREHIGLKTTSQERQSKSIRNKVNDKRYQHLRRSSISKLREIILDYTKKIRDVSGLLITLLQERDSLTQQVEVRQVAIAQLLKLQTGTLKP